MSATLAEINDRVYLELEVVGEFLSLDKIHNFVVQAHNVLTAETRTSTINSLLGVSAQFTPIALTHDVTALIGKGVPAFLEYLDNANVWQVMRIVSLPQLADYGNLGVMAAAFYGEESDSDSVEPIQYVAFSILPGQACRIRFDRDRVRKGIIDNIEIPDTVADYLVKKAQNSLIPRIKVAIDQRTRNDAALRAYAKDLKQSLSEIAAQNIIDMRPLDRLHLISAFKDRANAGSFNKLTPSGRGLYGSGMAF